ncbi:glycoside hydrolase family 2 protein [Ilyomonas limi]|uniref:Glycoside hydrolase family 2 protein n=1 Tax=Ilyomonas limi TaxID=2575867 RepID=A0A4U3KSM9_9BACT|nr:sugar-binding domain-containing protein [Ilyomonas limi]TKK65311.1 glycoside hydrolase family 2 protein [Ilyomonas limi]
MKSLIVLALLIFLQCTLQAQQLFNKNWQFHKGDIANGENNPSDTITWRSVNLPHDWSIEGPFSEEWASATAYLPGGIGWYKKTFTAPKEWQSKNVFIYFDGVYKNSTVWLNGHYLGNRPNGFIPFEYELTKYLNANGKNVLTVKVDHSEFADSRWYTGSGIYRNVYLIVKEPVHIAKWGVQFSTSNISPTGAFANTKVMVMNAGNKNATVTVLCSLKDNHGNVVAKESKQVNLNAADSGVANVSFYINNPQLWSVDNPALYQLSVSLLSNGKTVDTYAEQTGIRSIRIDADSGFFLNNQNLKLKGVCIHDDAGALGVAVPEAVWRRRLQTLKEVGCNSIRMSHNPHADYMYKLCDEMGFLVLDEAFDEWEIGKNKWIKGWNVGTPGKDGYHEYFKEWANIDVRDMILRNYNHPSIIAWSIGNEIDYPNDPYTSEVLNTGNNPQIYGKGYLLDHPPASRLGVLSKQLADVVKMYDTTRPVTAALAGVVMSNTTSYPDNLDWVGYNYQEYRYAEDHKLYPNRIIYGSENGMQLKAWNAVDSNRFISAQYLWTGIDYMGEAGRWPSRSNGAGLIDLGGFPKPEYYFRQSLWSNKPMIYIGTTHVQGNDDKSIWRHLKAEPTWNWNKGDKLRLNCFTNCTQAELFVNGKSLGKKKMADFPNRIIYWDVDYEPGEVKVIGYNNGAQAVTHSLQTTGTAYAIKAVAEKDSVGRTNLAQIIISVTDKDGNTVYNADDEITVMLKGDAVLLGLESGSHTSHEDYKANKRKALRGRLIAYIQVNNNAKNVEVVIISPGLQPTTIRL